MEEDLRDLMGNLGNFSIDPLDAQEFSFGDDFLQWLKENIEEGSVSVNAKDSMVHVVEEGVYVDRQIFKQYADMVKLPVNINVVFTQFGNLTGVVNSVGDYGFQFKQYFSGDFSSATKMRGFGSISSAQSQTRNGLLVNDPGVIFTGKNIPSTSAYLKLSQSLPKSLPEEKVNASNRLGRRRGK